MVMLVCYYLGCLFKKNKMFWVGYVVMFKVRCLFFSGDFGYGFYFVEIGKYYGLFDWVVLDDG